MPRELVQVPKKEWNEMVATLETLKDKEVLKGIERSRKEIRHGKSVTLEELEEELKNV